MQYEEETCVANLKAIVSLGGVPTQVFILMVIIQHWILLALMIFIFDFKFLT